VITRLRGRAGSNQLLEPVLAPPEAAGAEAADDVPGASSPGTTKKTTMTKAEFYAELESLLECEPGSIRGTESLSDLPGWDSIAALTFMALAEAKLDEVVSQQALAECKTVADLVNLFPGKIR
jgi:acyl carrier protein